MNEPVAYDLSCPNCDRSSYRLTLPGNGSAKCNHCGITYDLNNNGWILSTTDSTADNLRALYRYKINYNGVAINVFNQNNPIICTVTNLFKAVIADLSVLNP